MKNRTTIKRKEQNTKILTKLRSFSTYGISNNFSYYDTNLDIFLGEQLFFEL